MERTNKKGKTLTKYRKVGGGSLRFKNRIIKPGQEFNADPDEIPTAFLDTLEVLGEVKGTVKSGKSKDKGKKDKKSAGKKNEYTKVPVEDEEGMFNLVDKNGKVLNEEPLSEEAADEFLASLT